MSATVATGPPGAASASPKPGTPNVQVLDDSFTGRVATGGAISHGRQH